MDTEFKTTFIPKKKLATSRHVGSSKKSNSILSLLAGLLFVTALISIAGVFVYRSSISSGIEEKIKSINIAEKAFEPRLILELKKLDIRLEAGTGLLNQHIALSDFLDSLGESTLPDIAFNDFNFTFNAEGSEVTMLGEARGFLPIAQQSDIFENNLYIQNHIFSDFQLTETGSVSFSLSFTLNPELLSYGRKVKNTQTKTDFDKEFIIPNQNNNTLPTGENIDFNNLINANG